MSFDEHAHGPLYRPEMVDSSAKLTLQSNRRNNDVEIFDVSEIHRRLRSAPRDSISLPFDEGRRQHLRQKLAIQYFLPWLYVRDVALKRKSIFTPHLGRPPVGHTNR